MRGYLVPVVVMVTIVFLWFHLLVPMAIRLGQMGGSQ